MVLPGSARKVDGMAWASATTAWERQSVWSQTADRLKAGLARRRTTVLVLSSAGAALALASSQLAVEGSARIVSFAAAFAMAAAALVRQRVGSSELARWVQARSVSEALKAEVFYFLCRCAPYDSPDRDARLDEEVARLETDAEALLPETLTVEPKPRALPAVHDRASYVGERLSPQIDRYYAPMATTMARRGRRSRQVEIGLALVAAVLTAAAGAFAVAAVGAWAAVVTTVAASVAAHAAAERFDFLAVEYARTAGELRRLRTRGGWRDCPQPTGPQFVRRCEEIISVQNDKWMAKWGSTDGADATGTTGSKT